MGSWRATAVVWLNDKAKGCVVVGPCGFAWWEGRRCCIGAFTRFEVNPVTAFHEHTGAIRKLDKHDAPLTAVLRFVRTGLPPVQSRAAKP